MSTMSAITSALTTSFTSISADALDAIGTILPFALPVMGAMIVISLAIKTFRKAAK